MIEIPIQLKVALAILKKRWWILIIVLALSYGVAKVFLRYQSVVYTAYCELKLELYDESPQSQLFQSYGPMANRFLSPEDEIRVLKSNRLMASVLDSMKVYGSYQIHGDLVSHEQGTSFYNWGKTSDGFVRYPLGDVEVVPFEGGVQLFSVDKVDVYNVTRHTVDGACHFTGQRFLYGVNTLIDSVVICVKGMNEYVVNLNADYSFFGSKLMDLAPQYAAAINTSLADEYSGVLTLGFTHHNPAFSTKFLSQLVKNFKHLDYLKKVQSLDGSLGFIAEKLIELDTAISSKEEALFDLQRSNEVYNATGSLDTRIQDLSMGEKQLLDLDYQLDYCDHLISYIDTKDSLNELVVPSLVGIDNPALQTSINDLNKLFVENSGKNYSISEEHPAYQLNRLSASNIKNIAREAIQANKRQVELTKNDLKKRLAHTRVVLGGLPAVTFLMGRIERSLFSLNNLLKVLEEQQVVLSLSKSKVISKHYLLSLPYVDKESREPKPSSFVRKFLVLGGVFFVLIVLVVDFIPYKVHFEEELVGASVLSTEHVLLFKEDKSANDNYNNRAEEAVRRLRSTLSLALPQGGVIGVTSSRSGEGKSFLAIKLAQSYVKLGKKVLLIGGDLRRPKLQDYLEVHTSNTFTNYIIGDANWRNCVVHHEGFDLLATNDSFPDPVKYFSEGVFSTLLEETKRVYDYVLFDCAPLGIVEDYKFVQQQVDLSLVPFQVGVTVQQQAEKVLEGFKDKHVVLVNNKQKLVHLGYGYYYGDSYTKGYY